jgi:nitrous oxidase accessory protein NosD
MRYYNLFEEGEIVVITLIILLLAGSANAAILSVCPDGCAYSSIQEAINASSNDDTILVQSGTYFENVNVTRKLTLRGIGNPVVDAGGNGSAITLSANGITLKGFTATGSSSYPEAGIKITSSSNRISGNNASNNDYGIYLYYSKQHA